MLKLISLTMKLDFLILLCLSCLFTGCDNLVELEDTKSNDVSNQTTIRNPSTAAKIALLAKGMGKDTRGCLHTSVKSVQPVMGSITRSSVDTVLYAVNFENEDGFALVAAKNDVEPLLALYRNSFEFCHGRNYAIDGQKCMETGKFCAHSL